MEVNDIKTVISGICVAAAGLSIVLALIFNGTNKWNEGQQSGMSDARMMACIIAAISFFAAAALVQFVELEISLS